MFIVPNQAPIDHNESPPEPGDSAAESPPAAANDTGHQAGDRRSNAPRLDSAAIKARLTHVPAVLNALGLSEGATTQSDGITICCLFHGDTRPSCSVRSYGDGIGFKCFACGAKGSVFDLIAKVHGLEIGGDFRRVLELAAELADKLGATGTALQHIAPARPEIHESASRLLAACPLDRNPLAQTYLIQRGLFEEAKDDGWGALPSDPTELATLITNLGEHAVTLGLATANGKAKLAGHSLVIPWRAGDGRINTIHRRTLEPQGEPKYAMPAGLGAREPYGVDRLGGADRPLAIVEGAFDVLAYRKLCLEAGIVRDVIGLPGVTTWKGEWDSLAIGREVIVAFDDDKAGNEGAVKLVSRLMKAGATSIARRTPNGAKDWAELVEVKPVAEVRP
jgi:DNA primase